MDDLRACAEGIVSRRYGRSVVLAHEVEVLDTAWGTETPSVVRLRDPSTGETYIVKRDVRREDESAERSWWSWGNANEQAGLRFIGSLGLQPPIAPAFIGTDPSGHVIVLEDLGDEPSLDKLLLGDDPQATRDALLGLARTLGRMHAATGGRVDEYRAIRSDGYLPDTELHVEVERTIEAFLGVCERLDVRVAPRAMDEIASMRESLDDPGPFLVYTHGDPCPDNTRIVDGDVRLFDFEMGGFRHALLDGVYIHAPFPTCWCVNEIPADIWPDAQDAYRAELVAGCPEALDDRLFDEALATAWAFWTIDHTADDVTRAFGEDVEWGISTNRQRVFHYWRTFTFGAEATGHFVELECLGRDIVAALHAQWPDVEPMPRYPAFRSGDTPEPPGRSGDMPEPPGRSGSRPEPLGR